MVEELVKAAEQLNKLLPETTDAVRNFSNTASASAGDVLKLGAAASRAITDLNALTNINETFKQLPDQIKNLSNEMVEFGARGFFAIEPFIGILNRNIELFGKFGQAGDRSGSQISDSFNRLTPIIERFGGDKIKGLTTGFDNFLKSADKTVNLERNLLAIAAASGDLNSFLDATGEALKNITTETASFTTATQAVAEATGLLPSTVQAYATDAARIPGTLKNWITTQDGLSTSMSQLEAQIKLASAFGMQHSEVVNQLDTAYRDFGLTGVKALEFVSNMASAAQDLQMPMDMVQRYTMDAGRSFKMFGDNTEGALRILSRMRGALRDSNLGPEAIAELTRGMTEGLRNMNLAQASLVSAMSGGPGGIVGGLRVQQMMEEGKTGDVMSMMEQAFKRIAGGPIITRQQAIESPELAGQFVKQVEMLKSVFGMATTEQQASRIIDAMSKGNLEQFDQLVTGTEKLEEAVDRGRTVAERHTTKFTEMAQFMEKQVALQSINNMLLMRQILGTDRESPFAQQIISAMGQATQSSSTKGAIGVTEVTGQTTYNDMMKDSAEEYKNLPKTIVDNFTTISGVIQEQVGKAIGFGQKTGMIGGPDKLENTETPEKKPISTALFGEMPQPKINPTTIPPKAAETLAPLELRKATATGTGSTRSGAAKTENDVLHIIIDTKYYEGQTTKIARQEIEKMLSSKDRQAYTNIDVEAELGY